MRTWNEVEREIHDVSDNGLRRKLAERIFDNFSKSFNGIASRLYLSSLTDDASGVLGNERSIESVQESILQEKVAGDQIHDRGALIKYKENSRKDGQRAVDENQDGQLRKIGEEEHGRRNTYSQTNGR